MNYKDFKEYMSIAQYMDMISLLAFTVRCQMMVITITVTGSSINV